jgi:hypothetical protein
MAPTLHSLLKGRAFLKFILPAAAVTGALTIGAPSAQALQIGNLEFADGTGDFASQVNVLDPTDTFSVLFNTGANPVALVSGAGGLFVPSFAPAPPSAAVGVSAALANFTYFAPVSPFQALYTLNSDTAFTFANGVSVGIFGGVQFLVSQGTTAVQVEVTQNFAPELTSFVTGLPGGPVTVSAGAFTFNDTIQPTGGSYSAQVNVKRDAHEVPGPLSILGAGAAFGYSRRLRKRVKSAAVSS